MIDGRFCEMALDAGHRRAPDSLWDITAWDRVRNVIDQIAWEETGDGWRGELGDVVFLLDYQPPSGQDTGDRAVLSLFKPKYIVDQYADFLRRANLGQTDTLMELGIWEGGSVAFWNEVLSPRMHLAIDVLERQNSQALERYLTLRGRRDRIKTVWGVDQSDGPVLRSLLDANGMERLDLVIDDASHRYSLTKASFEALFPLVRPGGYYLIEDWAWAYMPEYRHPSHSLATEPSPARIVRQIMEMIASYSKSEGISTSMSVYPSFVAVERGTVDIPGAFRMEELVTRRQPPGLARSVYRHARHAAARIVR